LDNLEGYKTKGGEIVNGPPKRKLEIDSYNSIEKGALRGSATVSMPGLIIRKIPDFEKNGRRWISIPSEAFAGKDGKKKYTPLIEFPDKQTVELFRVAFFTALDDYLKLHPRQTKPNAPEISEEEIPW
jgi:hypothetical protein